MDIKICLKTSQLVSAVKLLQQLHTLGGMVVTLVHHAAALACTHQSVAQHHLCFAIAIYTTRLATVVIRLQCGMTECMPCSL